MKLIKSILICSLFLSIAGCASIAGNNTRAVKIDSQPSGAGIYIDNQQYGVTPAVVNLPAYIYGGKSVTVHKLGYHDQTQIVNTKLQPIALFDILLWPTFLIDIATGNIVKIDPANLNLNYRLQHV